MMNVPEYRLVDLAMDGVNNRNYITDVRTVRNFAGRRETYMTYFRYNEEMADHFQERGSVKGFNGTAYADWLPIDIDSSDLTEAQEMLNLLINSGFQRYEIDPNICRYYFSGSKGFHVMIPSALFGCEPGPDIEKRFKRIAQELCKGIKIDGSIYNKTRLFRLPNTINGKSGLYKRELYHFEAANMSIAEILAQATQPALEKYEIETEFDVSEELRELYHAPLEQAQPKQTAGTTGARAKVCMASILQGVGSGERDNAGVRVVVHLKQSGLTPQMVWTVLQEWNLHNKPALETYELERIYAQGMNGQYEFGCHDFMLKQYCNKECIFYKADWSRFA